MPGKITAQVKGLKEINARMLALPKEVSRSRMLLRALHDGARPIKAEAKRLAPVLQEPDPRRKAGAMRAEIVQHTSKDHYDTVVVRVRNRGWIFSKGRLANSALAGNPNYWWLVEFGTSKAPAQPFMRPAFERRKFEALQAIRASLARGLEVVAQQLQRIRVA